MTRTMVLIHGAFGGGWYWADFANYFTAQGWHCIAPDLRHHRIGAPLDDLARTSVNDFAADLATAIGELPEPPVLVGHSLGGLICQKLAARGLARALVLLAPSAPWGILPSSRGEIEVRLGLLRAGAFWRRALKPRFDIAAATALDRLSHARQEAAYAGMVPESGRALYEVLYWQLDPTGAAAVDAARVRCPVLCVTGEEDRIVSPATVRSIAACYRGRSSFHAFPGHGHWLFGEPGWEAIPAFCDGWLRHVLAVTAAV